MRIMKRLKSQIRQPIRINLSDRDTSTFDNPWSELRDQLRLTGAEMGSLTGQAAHSWSYYETGRIDRTYPSEPRPATLVKLADGLGCDLIIELTPRRKL